MEARIAEGGSKVGPGSVAPSGDNQRILPICMLLSYCGRLLESAANSGRSAPSISIMIYTVKNAILAQTPQRNSTPRLVNPYVRPHEICVRPAHFWFDFDRHPRPALYVEVPKMEAAVTAKDREYFESGLKRVKIFVGENWADLDKSPPCTNPKFEANLAMCRAAAKARQ